MHDADPCGTFVQIKKRCAFSQQMQSYIGRLGLVRGVWVRVLHAFTPRLAALELGTPYIST